MTASRAAFTSLPRMAAQRHDSVWCVGKRTGRSRDQVDQDGDERQDDDREVQPSVPIPSDRRDGRCWANIVMNIYMNVKQHFNVNQTTRAASASPDRSDCWHLSLLLSGNEPDRSRSLVLQGYPLDSPRRRHHPNGVNTFSTCEDCA